MRIDLKLRNLTHSPDIQPLAEEKLRAVEKILEQPEASRAYVEFGRDTHHQQGDVFTAAINLSTPSGDFRATAEGATLLAALDEARDELLRGVRSKKDKRRRFARRSAAKIKDFVRGFGPKRWRN